MLALGAIARAGVGWTPFPHWDGDPFTQGGPLVAIGPSALLVLDLVVCLGAALAIAAAPRVSRLGVGLFVVGAAGVAIHVAHSLEHAGAGSAWVAAMAGGLGAWHLGQYPVVRRALTCAAFGFVGMLVAKGALQYFVEHPQTVAHFRETRDAFFAARGWEPGSRSAMVYERRLMQPAATGWFGLSNVYATFMAGGAVLLLVGGLRSLREFRTRNASFVLLLGAIACAGALAMTGSKGAWGAALLGTAVGLVAMLLPKRVGRVLPWVLVLAPIGVIGAVLLRGVLGERLGELSLLFRAFYFEGAARVIASHPLVGVGPAGFKDAYVLKRPALSPEEVTSSHAVLVDWAATLGVLGLSWIALMLVWAKRSGSTPAATTDVAPVDERSVRLFVLITAVVVVAISGLVERAAITPEGAAMRAGGLVAWIALAWAIGQAWSARRWAAPMAGAAAAVLAHAQLDMAGVSETSAPLLLLWLGCLASPLSGGVSSRPARACAIFGPALAGVVVFTIAFPGLARWEGALRDAAKPATALADALFDLQSAASESEARAILERAASELGVTTPSDASVGAGFASLVAAAQDGAIGELQTAIDARPQHYGTRTALTRVLLQRATRPGSEPELADLRDRATRIAEGGPQAAPGSASSWMWAGTVHAGLADSPGITSDARAEHLRKAAEFWESAASLDPRGPSAPARLMAAYETLGDLDAARVWAERALQADANMRLDPLKQLTRDERARAERLTGR